MGGLGYFLGLVLALAGGCTGRPLSGVQEALLATGAALILLEAGVQSARELRRRGREG